MSNKHPASPMATLYHEGRETFIDLVPDGGARLDALFHTVPALGELAVGVVYGRLHSRPALDPRLREAVSFAAIIAAGMVGPPLSVHFKTGLASGLAPARWSRCCYRRRHSPGFPGRWLRRINSIGCSMTRAWSRRRLRRHGPLCWNFAKRFAKANRRFPSARASSDC